MKKKLIAFTTCLIMMASTFMPSFSYETVDATSHAETNGCIEACGYNDSTTNHEHDHDACTESVETIKSVTDKVYNAKAPDSEIVAVNADSLVVSAVASHTHSYTTRVTTVPATCTTQGYTIYKCSRCSSTTRTNYVYPKGHSCSTRTVSPSCTTQGYTLVTCTRSGCSYSVRSNYKSAYGHNYTQTVGTIRAATCTEKGLVIKKCSRCSSTSQVNTGALGHSCSAKSIAPTCTTQGYTQVTCTRGGCSYSYKTAYVNPLGHSCSSRTVSPTCITQGYTLTSCNRSGCTYSVRSNYKSALGHNYSQTVGTIKAATCTEKGLVVKKCSRCSSTSQLNTSALGHSCSSRTVSPTCITQGYTLTSCNRSGCTYSARSNYKSALGHNYSQTVGTIKAATCTEKGLVVKKCSRCSSTSQLNTSALGHSCSSRTVSPTCTTQGYTLTTCTRSNCTYSVKSDIKLEKGHSLTTKTVAPTCLTQGYTQATCTRSGCTYSIKSLYKAALGHDYAQTVGTIKEATCVEKGLVIKKCSRCTSTSQVNTELVEHVLGDYVVTVAPTSSRTGLKVKTCENCDYSESVVLDKVPADSSEYSFAPADENAPYGYVVFNGKYYPIRVVEYGSDAYIEAPKEVIASQNTVTSEVDWTSFWAGLALSDDGEDMLDNGKLGYAGGLFLTVADIPQQVADNTTHTYKKINIVEYSDGSGYATICIGTSDYSNSVEGCTTGERISIYDEVTLNNPILLIGYGHAILNDDVKELAAFVNELYGQDLIRISDSYQYDLVFELDNRRAGNPYSTTQYVDENGNLVTKPIAFSGDRLYIARRDGLFDYTCLLDITELTNPNSDKFCITFGY